MNIKKRYKKLLNNNILKPKYVYYDHKDQWGNAIKIYEVNKSQRLSLLLLELNNIFI